MPHDQLARRVHRDLLGHSEAVFDTEGQYRYLLIRRWMPGPPTLVMIMLNPSTADEEQDDATITRCVKLARREGAHALEVVNLFALRARNPAALLNTPDPVGPANDEFILEHAQPGRIVVAAWGAWGSHLGRGEHVASMLTSRGTDLHCLGLTMAGEPRHPLYLPADTPLTPWQRAAHTAA